MSPRDNNIDWSAPSTPQGETFRERVGPGLAPRPRRAPAAAKPPARSVMDVLLGKNDLAATDESGIDPYNATGRQFRR